MILYLLHFCSSCSLPASSIAVKYSTLRPDILCTFYVLNYGQRGQGSNLASRFPSHVLPPTLLSDTCFLLVYFTNYHCSRTSVKLRDWLWRWICPGHGFLLAMACLFLKEDVGNLYFCRIYVFFHNSKNEYTVAFNVVD